MLALILVLVLSAITVDLVRAQEYTSYQGLVLPFNVAVNSSGHIFVLDHNNNRVVVFTSGGSQVAVFTIAVSIRVNGNDIAIDSADVIYITTDDGRIIKLDSHGSIVAFFNTTIAASAAATGIAVDLSGQIYVAASNGVYKFAPDGTLLGVFNTISAASFYFLDVIVDADGNMYIADLLTSRVIILDAAGSQIGNMSVSVPPGDPASQVISLQRDSAGNVYVTDGRYRRIIKFAPDGTQLFQYNSSTSGLNQPGGVVFDGQGNMLVVEQFAGLVLQLALNGTQLTSFTGTYPSLYRPSSVAVDSGGYMFVAESTYGIAALRPNGTQRTIIPRLYYALGIGYTTVDLNGEIYVSSPSFGLLYKVSINGTQFDAITTSNPAMNRPQELTLDAFGRILVADMYNNRILQMDNTGDVVGIITLQNSSVTPLFHPNMVAIDFAGFIYISDWYYRIVKLTPNGTTFVQNITGLSVQPSGLAVDTAGRIYYSDAINNVIVVLLSNGTYFASLQTVAPALSTPSGLAVDSANNLYVTDQSNNRLVKFFPFISPPAPKADGGLDSGTVTGIIIAVVVFVLIIIVAVYAVLCRRLNPTTSAASSQVESAQTEMPDVSAPSINPYFQQTDEQ